VVRFLIMEVSQERKELDKKAEVFAKKILKQGDRVRCIKCPGTKRTFTFDHWDGCWMVSKAGIDDYHPINVDLVNGKTLYFTFSKHFNF
jgi:hypothetical protein